MNAAERNRKIREQNIREVIQAAKKLFTEKGYKNTSMDEVAEASGFTKRTMYSYFTGKEDLHYAVSYSMFQELAEYIQKNISNPVSLQELVYQTGQGYKGFYRANRHEFPLIVTGHLPDKGNIPYRDKLAAYRKMMIGEFLRYMDLAEETGQTRRNSPLTALSIQFLINGFFAILSETEEGLKANYQVKIDEFIDHTISLIAKSVQENKENNK